MTDGQAVGSNLKPLHGRPLLGPATRRVSPVDSRAAVQEGRQTELVQEWSSSLDEKLENLE